ncbi:MAG: prolipoprotein diacylglyceryl transferase [Eubacterium sp.]|nr:prolipoprotein diacylglyceryl transferase [Eubacterium sp.]
MYNNLFSIGPFTVHTYGLCTAIGIIAAYYLAERRAKQKNFTEREVNSIFGLVIFCLIFGYLGSKLLYIITMIPAIAADPAILRESITNGWVIFGGLLGGIFGGWVYCKWQKLPTGKFYDMGMPAVALAQGFGRLGCFFAGCCYGVETDSAFSIVFKNSELAPNNVHLVPTQLLSSAGDFLLAWILVMYDKKAKKNDGETAGLYLVLYSLGRFIIEFWRGDLIRGAVGPLSTSQFIGLFTLAAGVILLLVIRLRKKAEASTEAAETTTEEAAAEAAAETAETTTEEATAEASAEAAEETTADEPSQEGIEEAAAETASEKAE